jgi:hypothetical protein
MQEEQKYKSVDRKAMKERKGDGQHNFFHPVIVLPISVSLLRCKYLSLTLYRGQVLLRKFCLTIWR